jgi:hypothetical protein
MAAFGICRSSESSIIRFVDDNPSSLYDVDGTPAMYIGETGWALTEHMEQVFARDIGTAPPYELVKVVDTNVPVKLQTDEQDVTIHPGDYLIGDLNGVVVLPKDLAEKALPLMAKQAEADAQMAVAIGNGMSFTEAGKKFRA